MTWPLLHTKVVDKRCAPLPLGGTNKSAFLVDDRDYRGNLLAM